MADRYDIAIVGSGFAGSLLAMILRRVVRSVVLLERGTHPRFAIGESSTPLSNLLLEELATRYDLHAIRPLSKWGSWQASHPELICGLKRGFSFFHHNLGQSGTAALERSNQLLVAASPHNGIADTHWYRADVDHFFVREAQQLGVDFVDACELLEIATNGSETILKGKRNNRDLMIAAKFVVDASGPRGFLHRFLKLEQRALPNLPATQALYSHFSGVRRLDNLFGRERWESAPYPVEEAAVHHVFDGGWVWVLHFANGITSAGVAATTPLAERFRFFEGEQAWERLLQQMPLLREQFAVAKAVQPFRNIAQLGLRSAAIAGPNWALLPSAAGFVDPLLSTGFPLTLLGVARLAEVIERDWSSPSFNEALARYARHTDAELLATSHLVGALYANMKNFPVFAALSLVYFAAASYSEAARRLGMPHLAESFLLHDHPQFGPACSRILERAQHIQTSDESQRLIDDVYRTIEPIDVAGLGKKHRFNWYPVGADDLLDSAHKLGASHQDAVRMLERCGLDMATSQS